MSELNTQIPRIDPDNKLGADFHAARATERFRADRMAIDGREPEALATAKFRDGDNVQEMRKKIQNYLDVISGVKSPEQIELLSNLEKQYYIASLVWTKLIPLDTTEMPTQADLAAWLSALSPEELAEISAYGAPQVQIIPKGKTLDHLDKIVGSIDVDGDDGDIHDDLELFDDDGEDLSEHRRILANWKRYGAPQWKDGWENVESEGWKFSITDASPEMPRIPGVHIGPDDLRSQNPFDILEKYISMYEGKISDMIPQYAYLAATLTSLLQGRSLDVQGQTIFRQADETSNLIPSAHLDGSNSLYLDHIHGGDDHQDYMRTRPYIEQK